MKIADDPGDPERGRRHDNLAQLFQWLGGYSPKNLTQESSEACEPIGKLGGTVLFAALIASTNWAIAAFIFTRENGLAAGIIAAVVAAVVGASMVLVIDRSVLYFCDSMAIRRISLTLWIAVRAVILVAIGSVTAQQALVPVILWGPLQAHALRMQEGADDRRIAGLTNSYNISGKTEAVAAATAKLIELESEPKTLPASIQAQFGEARHCWSNYAKRKQVRLYRGETEVTAKAALRTVANRCAQKQKVANDAKERHEAVQWLRHEDAVSKKTAANAALESTTATVATRREEARVIEKAALNPRSPTVQADLLATDPGAKVTFLICAFLLMAMELLPVIGKTLVGKTPVGRRLSVERAVDGMHLDERLAQAKRDIAISREIANSTQSAIMAACKSPEIAQICTELFSKKIASLIPLEVVHAFLRELERTQFDADRAVGQYPRHAPIIIEMVAAAVREAGQILRSGAVLPEEENSGAKERRTHGSQPKAA